jgi:hypothetical protein
VAFWGWCLFCLCVLVRVIGVCSLSRVHTLASNASPRQNKQPSKNQPQTQKVVGDVVAVGSEVTAFKVRRRGVCYACVFDTATRSAQAFFFARREPQSQPTKQHTTKPPQTTPKRNPKQVGSVVGYGWLKGSCRACSFCLRGEENLCLQGQPTIVGGARVVVFLGSSVLLQGLGARGGGCRAPPRFAAEQAFRSRPHKKTRHKNNQTPIRLNKTARAHKKTQRSRQLWRVPAARKAAGRFRVPHP